MKIYYGTNEKCVDVTNICYKNLLKNNIITIPSKESSRTFYFTDPVNGYLKKIFIVINDTINEYDHLQTIKINLLDNTISLVSDNEIDNKLNEIHSKLKINHGILNDEVPEQKMAVRYLKGTEKVLEIGANIGRNSLVIAQILNNTVPECDTYNFVTMECDNDISKQLKENRDLNNFHFKIETSALSKRKLIQRGWDTIVSDELLDGFKAVNTITLKELKEKYNIPFDTLILDCEGALYYILMDMPEILDGIKLIIMENDYHEINKKIFVDEILKDRNFYRDYVEGGGWGPCANFFFEVWKRD